MPLRRTLLTAALAAAVFSTPLRAQEPADWVDPFIGTTNFGTTNPGAVCPNGMMSVVPFNVMGSDENLYDRTPGGGRRPMSTATSSSRALHTSP